MTSLEIDLPDRRVLMVVNPQAAGRRGLSLWERLQPRLAGRRFDAVFTTRAQEAAELAEAAAPNYDTVVAVGGDGTVNEVLNGLLRSRSHRPALAVLPLGTGNDVAVHLGVAEVPAAVRTAFSGSHWKMDVIDAECRGEPGEARRFSSVMYVALGIAGAMGQLTTPWMKRWLGPRWCYSAGFVRALVRHRSPHMRIAADGRVFQGPMLLAAAGNIEVIGGGTLRLFPGATPDDGQMDVNVISHLSHVETLRCFGKVRVGTHTSHPNVEYFRANRVVIESDPSLPVNFDGEVGGVTPVTLTLRPQALTVLRSGPGSSDEP